MRSIKPTIWKIRIASGQNRCGVCERWIEEETHMAMAGISHICLLCMLRLITKGLFIGNKNKEMYKEILKYKEELVLLRLTE